MNRHVALRAEAFAHMAEAFLWYQRERPGLGWQFLEDLEAVFTLLVERPEAGPSCTAACDASSCGGFRTSCITKQLRRSRSGPSCIPGNARVAGGFAREVELGLLRVLTDTTFAWNIEVWERAL